jgi:hypothetical protein
VSRQAPVFAPAWQGEGEAQGADAMFDIFNVHNVSLILVVLGIVAVFQYIPVVSEYAFWFVLAGYVMLAQYRPAKK